MSYQTFRFIDYSFDTDKKQLQLEYGYDENLRFQETFTFDFEFSAYNEAVLDTAIQHLFFMAGISYYKAFLAPVLKVEKGRIGPTLKEFLDKTYQRGLGEFWYVNGLDPRKEIDFPLHEDAISRRQNDGQGLLVGIGGGKDSLVSVEVLRDSGLDIATWSMGHRKQLAPLIDRIGLNHYWVDREWDKKLLELNDKGAYNGHVPISAIIACVGTIVAVLTGRRDHVVSNEQSANEPTLEYQGIAINHQYSKSQEFEETYQKLLETFFGKEIRYYSLLRPLRELRIAELFAQFGFQKYKDVFSSCNRAFTHDSPGLYWDGKCPKCAFVFLALSPFVKHQELEELFEGKNLLLEPSLRLTYEQLLGISGDKPLECVGEVKESRAAMSENKKIYPELNIYTYDLPSDYDFRSISGHNIPEDIWPYIKLVLEA